MLVLHTNEGQAGHELGGNGSNIVGDGRWACSTEDVSVPLFSKALVWNSTKVCILTKQRSNGRNTTKDSSDILHSVDDCADGVPL